MLTQKQINKCIDSARILTESLGRKNTKYYHKNLVSRIFGIYKSPKYPDLSDINYFEILWKEYAPSLFDKEKKLDLLFQWVEIIGITPHASKGEIIAQIQWIRKRQENDYINGLKVGIKYNFVDPFELVTWDFVKKNSNELSRTDSIDSQCDELKPRIELFGSQKWHYLYLAGDTVTFVYLTFFDGYEYSMFNWLIAIPVNMFLSTIWPLYWLILHWIF